MAKDDPTPPPPPAVGGSNAPTGNNKAACDRLTALGKEVATMGIPAPQLADLQSNIASYFHVAGCGRI